MSYQDNASENSSESEYTGNHLFDIKKLTRSTKTIENGVEVEFFPPLMASLFENVPPTILFVAPDEKSIIGK